MSYYDETTDVIVFGVGRRGEAIVQGKEDTIRIKDVCEKTVNTVVNDEKISVEEYTPKEIKEKWIFMKTSDIQNLWWNLKNRIPCTLLDLCTLSDFEEYIIKHYN